jgi:hypothetical protein
MSNLPTLGVNPELRGDKPAANRPHYSTVKWQKLNFKIPEGKAGFGTNVTPCEEQQQQAVKHGTIDMNRHGKTELQEKKSSMPLKRVLEYW